MSYLYRIHLTMGTVNSKPRELRGVLTIAYFDQLGLPRLS